MSHTRGRRSCSAVSAVVGFGWSMDAGKVKFLGGDGGGGGFVELI